MGFIERLKQEIREKPERERIAREAEQRRKIEEQNRPAQKTREASAIEQSKKHLEISGLPSLINDLSAVLRGSIKVCEFGDAFDNEIMMQLTWDEHHTIREEDKHMCIFVKPNGKITLMPSGSKLRIKTTSTKLARSPEVRERIVEEIFRNASAQGYGRSYSENSPGN